MVKDCQIERLSELSEHDYRSLTMSEYDLVASVYRNVDELDEASLYVLYVAHKTLSSKLNPYQSWKSLKYFLAMSASEENKDMVSRYIFVVGENQDGQKRFSVVSRQLKMSVDRLVDKLCEAIDFNELLLEMECVKRQLERVVVASLDSDFSLTEKILFDACKHFDELEEYIGSCPKIYKNISGLAINHERMLYHMHGKRKHTSFMSDGIKYHVFSN